MSAQPKLTVSRARARKGLDVSQVQAINTTMDELHKAYGEMGLSQVRSWLHLHHRQLNHLREIARLEAELAAFRARGKGAR